MTAEKLYPRGVENVQNYFRIEELRKSQEKGQNVIFRTSRQWSTTLVISSHWSDRPSQEGFFGEIR
jgi:hypothetical protein